jgi:hypothetical protein
MGKQPVKGALTMTYDYGKPLDVYERLGSIRMSAAERRDAMAKLKRGEAMADLILGGVSLLRRAAAGVSQVFRRIGQGLSQQYKEFPNI